MLECQQIIRLSWKFTWIHIFTRGTRWKCQNWLFDDWDVIATSNMTSESRISHRKIKISNFWHLHRVPRVKICIYTNFQLNLIISWHTLYEWHFGLSYDIWRHIWRHNHVLTLQKFLNIIIQTSLSVFHPKKNSPLRSLRPTRSF